MTCVVRSPLNMILHWEIITLYRKSDLCVPKNETARPRSQFQNSCICERFFYSQDLSAFLAAAKIGRQILGIYESFTDTWMWNWENWFYVLEITRPPIHLFWIFTGPSFAVHLMTHGLNKSLYIWYFCRKFSALFLKKAASKMLNRILKSAPKVEYSWCALIILINPTARRKYQ